MLIGWNCFNIVHKNKLLFFNKNERGEGDFAFLPKFLSLNPLHKKYRACFIFHFFTIWFCVWLEIIVYNGKKKSPFSIPLRMLWYFNKVNFHLKLDLEVKALNKWFMHFHKTVIVCVFFHLLLCCHITFVVPPWNIHDTCILHCISLN